MKRIFVITAVMALAAMTAQGATVEVLGVDLGGGQLEVYVTDTVAHSATNRGLQGVGMSIGGTITGVAWEALSIITAVGPPMVVEGFDTLGATQIQPGQYDFGAVQTGFAAGNVILKAAQEPVTTTGGLLGDISLAVPMKMGTISYTGARPTIYGVTGTVLQDDVTNYKVASVDASGSVIPEPMTLTLLGIGGLALIRRRK